MPDCRFYSRPFAEEFVFLLSGIITILVFGNIGYYYLCPIDFLFAFVSPLTGQKFDFPARNTFHLFKTILYGMSVIFILEGFGTQNNSILGTYDGDLVAKLIFLMFLAFTDTLYFRFIQGVDLMSRITSLAEDPFIESE